MNHSKYYGHPSQLYGVTECRLTGGRSDGMRIFHVRNGLGLEFDVAADRCADIVHLSLDGKTISYTSVGGLTAPAYYNEGTDGFGFLKSFNCGFLTTCGLHNIGSPNTSDGVPYGLHGTIGNLPAEHIYYDITEDTIYIKAVISDAVIFGSKFTLHRTISCSLLENKMSIQDRIQNDGSKEEPLMLLYHMNMGYPLLDEHALLSINSTDIIPRDEHAAKDTATWNKMLPPTANFQEQCYYHVFEKETACAGVFNPQIEKGLAITFDTTVFPQMTQWKMMGERDYVLGLEPCTNTLEGRDTIAKKKQLQILAPGEAKDVSVDISFYNNQKTWENALL